MLVKTNTNINFAQGLDTKSDPKQVRLGKFLSLQNSIFTKAGLLQKRNGFKQLPAVPDTTASYLTTFNGNLTAVGQAISAYSQGAGSWVSKGNIQPCSVGTLPIIKNNLNQTQCDSVVASNGLICTVYSELNSSTTTYKYVVSDSVTGQNIVAPVAIPVSSGVVTGSPRVFLLGSYFVIVFTNVISATSHLQYITVSSVNPTSVTANTDIASSYVSSTNLSWDGVSSGNNLYISYAATSSTISTVYLTQQAAASAGVPSAAVTFSQKATSVSVCVDNMNPSSPTIWTALYRSDTSVGYVYALDQNLGTILGLTQIISTGTILNLASAAQNGTITVFQEVSNNYSFDSSIPTHFVRAVTCTSAGTVGTPFTVVRSVGLASKAFIVSGTIYFLSAYQSTYQPTFFLINGSTSVQAGPIVVAKIAYENGGGYLSVGLPSVSISRSTAQFTYLYKDLIAPLATLGNSQQTTNAGSGGGVYAQTGINLASIQIGTQNIDTAEIGSDLHVSGGFFWMYDGYIPVEHNFFLWPDMDTANPTDAASWSTTGGSVHAQPDGATNTNAYYYQVTYEWSDNQGNIFRSAPSIPIAVTTTGSGTSGSITLNIPTLRLTYKNANPVKIVIYRWSVANQDYYQVTSLTAPTLNSTTSDSIQYVDTLADASIVGNALIYTTGGVIEDINAPASNIMTLFDTRLWLVDAEDPNLLWFSKQVIEATPVEMSDLLTYYVAPNAGVQQSTGPITGLAAMDDKLIIFKADAIYYINGSGPDNTGANNQYSNPIFVTTTVGCANQQSIVLTPAGLMFQSDKGIWLLGRDLSTSYIGAPVEAYNTSTVQSGVNVPETTQIRFTLNTGQTLMYDYYYDQWAVFVGVPAISSCIYNKLHTILNSTDGVYQENPGSYLDGSNPVLMSFTTSWFNLAGLQGYMRAYEFFLLGSYVTPHKLSLQIAYDYGDGPEQSTLITPQNFSPAYGNIGPYGQGTGVGTPYGGPGSLENWRVFLQKQRCQAFQITLNEVYNSDPGVPAGAGLTLSGINLVYAVKKGWRTISAAQSAG